MSGGAIAQRAQRRSEICPGFEEGDVFGVFLGEDFAAVAHVGAHQLVGGGVEITELEVHLAEAKMKERIAEAAGQVIAY